MRILIAEDDTTSRLFMRKFLEKYGTCDFAMNGIEAIDHVSEAQSKGERYDLICLDVMMPKVNGIKALQMIRQMEASGDRSMTPSKVIMITALNDKATVEEAYACGADAYAWKPIDVVKFKEVLVDLKLVEG